MRYLVDTCVISELVKKQPSGKVIAWIEDQDESSLHLSVLTFGELEKGIRKLDEGTRRTRLQRWVDVDLSRRFSGRILPVDREVATRWGEIAGSAEKIGKRVPVLDGLLAATALVGGLTLVTRNTEPMRETGARLLDPWAL